jgi:hypothetical protein
LLSCRALASPEPCRFIPAHPPHFYALFVHAAWPYRQPPRIGAPLARRSQGQPKAVLAQAWQAQHRLHRRYRHLVGHGKRPPVAVVAIARELGGFV